MVRKRFVQSHWRDVLTDVLDSPHPLFCTATNAVVVQQRPPTRHLFGCRQHCTTVTSGPSRLKKQWTALLKRPVCASKLDSVVDEVVLIKTNPHYAHVSCPDGRLQITVATTHLTLERRNIATTDAAQKENQVDFGWSDFNVIATWWALFCPTGSLFPAQMISNNGRYFEWRYLLVTVLKIKKLNCYVGPIKRRTPCWTIELPMF